MACSWRQRSWAARVGPGELGFGPISEERGAALEWPNGAQRGEKRRPAWEKDGPQQQQAFGPKRIRRSDSIFFQFLSKAILNAKIQIKFKLEFKSNHSKN